MAKAIEEYTLKEIMGRIETAVNEKPEPIQGFNASYQFNIEGEGGGSYQLHFKDGKASVNETGDAPADCTLNMSLASFHQFMQGKLNGTVAFMTGKLKIKGDIGKAIKIEGILRQYNVSEYL